MPSQTMRSCSWFAALVALAATAGCATPAPSGVAEEAVGQVSQALTLPGHVVEGYWHNFYNTSVCPMRLTAIASYWDVVHVSFAENAGSGNVAFNLYTPRAGEPCSALDANQFKADIATLKSQNKAVILSLGGAEGAISIGSATEQTNFENSLKSIMTTWGFSGLDVDLESGSGFTHGSQIQARLPSALQNLASWYSAQPAPLGGHMFLTMAPEHPYVHGGVVAYSGIWGSYLPMISSLSSQLDILHTQLYNNGSVTTPNVAPYNGTNFPVDSVDNLVASVKMLVEGFDTAGGPHFNGIPASKVAFGVPSGPKSSNPPFIGTNTIKNAYSCVTANTNCGTLHMNTVQPSFRGVMTWSINWDAYDVANNTAGRVDFANIKAFMGGGSCTPESDAAFCSRLGKNCGSVTASDNCGTNRTVSSCGSCTSPQTCGGGGTGNVCGGGTSGPDRTEGGTASGTGTACNSTTEDVTKLYDNLMTSSSFSKWCVSGAPSTGTPISAMYTFGGSSAYMITSYTITTGNDAAGRDPKDWTLQGCSGSCTVGSDTGWTTIDTRTGQFAGAARYQTSTYAVSSGTGYRQIRLRVTANNGDTGTFQVGELQLFGDLVSSCTPESDAAFCSRLGKNCGSVTAADNCGTNRTVGSCGSCTSPQTCGGGGTANVCGGGGSSQTFSATGLPLAIPDNTPGGVTKSIGVSGVSSTATVTATVDITHTYQGDLKVTLIGPNSASSVLWSQTGGGADDVHLLNVDVTSIAGNRNGTWQLKVEDLAAADVGNLTNFALTFNGGSSCTPTTCAAQGKNCGSISDGCGGTLSCGGCTSPQTCGGGGTANVCGGGTAGPDRTEGGTASGTGTACNSTTEDVTKVYDNLMTSSSFSKWCVSAAPSATTPISTMYTFGGSSTYVVTSYTLTAGNDAATRDPKDWTFQGCGGSCTAGSDTGWTTLDTRTGQFAGAARYQTNTYSFSNATAYRQFRLRVTANNGDTGTFQMGELQMFGNTGSGGTCGTPYAQGNCGTYVQGTQVSNGGHNWTCANGNCANCASTASCAPGATGCPWGVVWTDNGTCQ
jgi:chitinase